MMGLSYDWTSMNTLVNQMSPNGNTNQAIGLAWGWLSLVGGGPLTAPAMDPNYQYQQVIILLTDGLNTQDRWYSNQSSIDARQQVHLQQHQGRGDHAVYGAGRHRRRSDVDAAAELRERCQQVLPAEVRERNHHHVHHHRQYHLEAAHRQVGPDSPRGVGRSATAKRRRRIDSSLRVRARSYSSAMKSKAAPAGE